MARRSRGRARAGARRRGRAAAGADVPERSARASRDALDGWTSLDGELYVILDQFEEYFALPRAAKTGPGQFAADFPRAVDRRRGARALRSCPPRGRAGPAGSLQGSRSRSSSRTRSGSTASTGGRARGDRGPLGVERDAGTPVEREAGLVEAVLDEVARGTTRDRPRIGQRRDADAARIETPYLQLVMQRVWDAERRPAPRPPRGTLEALGGADGSSRDHLEARSPRSSGREGRGAEMFNYLVTPSGTKIAHGAADLAEYAGVDRAIERGVLPLSTRSASCDRSKPPGGTARPGTRSSTTSSPTRCLPGGRLTSLRALEHERVAARRRQRQLLLIAALALLALAVVGSIAVYAWDQRAEARAAEADAVAARDEAEQTRDDLLESNQDLKGRRRTPSPSKTPRSSRPETHCGRLRKTSRGRTPSWR